MLLNLEVVGFFFKIVLDLAPFPQVISLNLFHIIVNYVKHENLSRKIHFPTNHFNTFP